MYHARLQARSASALGWLGPCRRVWREESGLEQEADEGVTLALPTLDF
jgi:hypothetical protein